MRNRLVVLPSMLARLPSNRSIVLVSNSHFHESACLQRQRLKFFRDLDPEL